MAQGDKTMKYTKIVVRCVFVIVFIISIVGCDPPTTTRLTAEQVTNIMTGTWHNAGATEIFIFSNNEIFTNTRGGNMRSGTWRVFNRIGDDTRTTVVLCYDDRASGELCLGQAIGDDIVFSNNNQTMTIGSTAYTKQ